MTTRMLTPADRNPSCINVKGPNVFIGNKTLWAVSLDESGLRFLNINKSPTVLSSTKEHKLPKWEKLSKRKIDFRLQVYNRNIYNAKTE